METMTTPTLTSIRRLTTRCRCSMCGSYRVVLSDKTYRLVATDGEVLPLAVLTCQDCSQVRLFEVEETSAGLHE